MNPYAQGGWSNSHNPNAANNQPWGTGASVYGALPYVPPPSSTPNFHTFAFVSSDGTVLNAHIVGPQSRTYFRVNTNSTSSGFSVIENSNLQSISVIEWGRHPVVEIRDILSKRSTATWLALSPDKTHRVMTVRGKNFCWTPTEDYIELCNTGVANPQLYGRISQSSSGTILELTSEAVRIGLLEVGVVSTLLLMSGRSID
ncbi:hypothetical protein C8R43DRAFT_1161443 [Mycena crocata]|nr:hypothetical protein C8R43DRAFT_1161443 [Mycena crocata]